MLLLLLLLLRMPITWRRCQGRRFCTTTNSCRVHVTMSRQTFGGCSRKVNLQPTAIMWMWKRRSGNGKHLEQPQVTLRQLQMQSMLLGMVLRVVGVQVEVEVLG
jgi:hypothetical protein